MYETVERLIADDAVSLLVKGAMPSLPTITEVQELLRERGYEDFDLSLLDVLH